MYNNKNPEEIKKKYRQLALEKHPDQNSTPSAAEEFKEINTAYEYLRQNTLPAKDPSLLESLSTWVKENLRHDNNNNNNNNVQPQSPSSNDVDDVD